MKAVKLTKDKHRIWDEFCLKSDDAWFLHSTDALEYYLNYKPELKSQNLSFLVYVKDEVKAIVPLASEVYIIDGEEEHEFSLGGAALLVPALSNDLSSTKRDSIYEFILDEVDCLAYENIISRASFRQMPISLGFLKRVIPFNDILKFGYLDISLNTLIIDLKKTEEELWDNLRRNHRRNILKADKFKFEVYTSKNITKDVYAQYKEAHHRAAGRKTRPDITFELMFDWIEKDLAFLSVVEFEEKLIGFEYFIVYKGNVVGGSAANDTDYKHLPIRHFLEWESILWMKKNGFSFYEIGLQQYGVLPYDFPDEKQLNITHFKKGFGGTAVPLFIGEKIYNEQYFKKIHEERYRKFLKLYKFNNSHEKENIISKSFV